MAVPRLTSLLLIFFLVFPAALPEVKAQQEKDEPYVGVNIGTDVSNLLPPAKLVSFLQQQKVTHIRIYDSDPEILKALSKTKIRVIISVPNNQILGIGSSNTTTANWINKNVAAFYPDTLITTVADQQEEEESASSSVLTRRRRKCKSQCRVYKSSKRDYCSSSSSPQPGDTQVENEVTKSS